MNDKTEQKAVAAKRGPFEPNERGLVPVKLLKNYGTNVAGETAGFLPEIAKELVKKGAAHLPGQPPKAEKKAEAKQEGAEVTSRKFQPEKKANA